MLARLSKSTVKALGLKLPQGSITASRSSSHSAFDGDELVIDLDLLQLVRPIQDLARLLDGCSKTFAPVWNNIQSTLSYDVEQWALLLLELEEDYEDEQEDEEDMESTFMAPDGSERHMIPTTSTNIPVKNSLTRKEQHSSYLYGERPPRIQRASSYITQPKIIPSSGPSIPTIVITPCVEKPPSSSTSRVPLQNSAFNTRLTVPSHYPLYNQAFPPMLPPGKTPELSLKWRWHRGHWEAVIPVLEEQERDGLFSRALVRKGRRRLGKSSRASGNGSGGKRGVHRCRRLCGNQSAL